MSTENMTGILMLKPNMGFRHTQLGFDIKTPVENWLILPKNLSKSHGMMHAVTAR